MKMLIISDEQRKTFEGRMEKYHRFKKGPKARQFSGAPVLVKVDEAEDPQWIAWGMAPDGASVHDRPRDGEHWIAVNELFFYPGFHPNRGWYSLAMTREEWRGFVQDAGGYGSVGAVQPGSAA